MLIPDEHTPLERTCSAEALPAEARPAPGAQPAALPDASAPPLAHLLAGHLLPDGEIVILLLKPSLLYIFLTSATTLGMAAVIAISGTLFDDKIPGHPSVYLNAGILLAVSRLMWSTVQWMGKYYILTDRRLMTLSGVFRTHLFEVELRRIARVRILRNFREKLFFVGNLEIIPQEDTLPISIWQIIPRPRETRERIQQAIAKAKSCGRGN